MARKSQKKRAKQHHAANNKEQAERDRNPLLTAQRKFITSLPKEVRSHFFSPTHLTPEQRAQIWEDQADLGEKLVDSYAWATPDSRLLPVLKHFGPIVEIGCGANAYWAKWMHDGGVDVIAFDVSLQQGGKISSGSNKKAQKNDSTNATHAKKGLIIREGGPEMLSDPEIKDSDRALFLCYPDEEDMPPSQPVDDDESEERYQPLSMAAACLEHFTGDTIIHVGEVFGDSLSFDQAPWGRSSSNEFLERLSCEYHCILKMKLESNWLHVRDTLSVWKRSDTCTMVFGDDDEDSSEEVEYKYIPPDEVLPLDAAAPCVAHLLKKKAEKNTDANDVERKRKRKDDETQHNQIIAGNAW
jgi:hypothetical protein